jgi:3D (Asp-Asp-Asp) domain-containing protein
MLRRIGTITASVLAILTIWVFPSASAWGAPVPGGTLTNGTAVNGTVSTAEGIAYTFTAVQGKHVTLALTAPHVAPSGTRLQMNVYDSSGAQDAGGVVITTANTDIDFTPSLNQVGATTVVVSPYDGGSTGTFTLTYALDATGALTSGTPVTGTLAHGGQHASYTFTAVQGKHVTLAITAPHVATAGARLQLNVYNSSGNPDAGAVVFSATATEIDFTPSRTMAGSTTVVVSPYDAGTTGGFTLTYATDVTGALTSGTPVTGSLSYAGQQAAYTFTAVQGKHVTLALTGTSVSPAGSRLQMNVYNASGNPDAGTVVFTATPTEIDFTPSAEQSGPTTVVISRYDFEATGHFTLTYATDVTGALTSGSAVAGALKYAGQQTAYTFTAVAGVPVKLAITSPVVAPAGSRLQLNAYDSSGAADAGAVVFSNTPQQTTFTPTAAQAGPTTVVVSKYDFETTGTFTVTYTSG